ncbi:hypothetical protein [Methylobacterium bullatum]|uniref:hypothetical protein n=1 Tax=Methylobacterium bullatum TaxID=570505 RepID=UPI0030D18518
MPPVDERNPPLPEDAPLPRTVLDHATAGAGQSAPHRPLIAGLSRLDLITETEAYATYSHLLEDKELRRARQSGALGYLRRKRTVFYRREELEAFVRDQVEKDYITPWQSRETAPGTPTRTTASIPTPPASASLPDASDTIPSEVYHRVLTGLTRRPAGRGRSR